MTDVKILLIEDENIEAMDIKQTLESFGYEVPYVASSGEEAVDKALEIIPDLILMDIVIKGDTEGIESIILRFKDLNIPFIYLTTHSEKSKIEKAKITEPSGYIIKPYDRNELKYAIELAIYKNQMNKELKEIYNREQYLADIIRNATVSIGTGYPDGRLGFVNKAFEKLTGYSEEELKTIKWNQELTPEKWKLIEQNFLDELELSKKSVQYEKEYRKKDGSIVPIEIVVNPHLDSKGNIDHYFTFITDITERNKIQNDLKASEGLLRGLFDNMPSGMSVYKVNNDGSKGSDYIIQEFNKYSQRIEGMKRKEVIGKSLYDIRPKIDEYGLIPIFKKVWETVNQLSILQKFT